MKDPGITATLPGTAAKQILWNCVYIKVICSSGQPGEVVARVPTDFSAAIRSNLHQEAVWHRGSGIGGWSFRLRFPRPWVGLSRLRQATSSGKGTTDPIG